MARLGPCGGGKLPVVRSPRVADPPLYSRCILLFFWSVNCGISTTCPPISFRSRAIRSTAPQPFST